MQKKDVSTKPVDIEALELAAATPVPVSDTGFNPEAILPYGLEVSHVRDAMNSFVEFLGFLNRELNTRQIERLETMLMPANYSSIVGEFMSSGIPKYSPTIVKNRYHNGHPDMLPKGKYRNDEAQHESEGIEIKGSRYLKGWQGHNAEDVWLMVFVFDSNRPTDSPNPTNPGPDKNGKARPTPKAVFPKPFRFVKVVCAKIEKSDWKEAGRNEGSRRTPTATVIASGVKKMEDNWIYRDPDIKTLKLADDANDPESEHRENSEEASLFEEAE